jgi:hypothetical protein
MLVAGTSQSGPMLVAGDTKGCQVEPGAGEEAVEQAGAVLHPLKPGLDQRGELGEVAFGQVGQGSFRWDQTGSTGLSSWAYGGSR